MKTFMFGDKKEAAAFSGYFFYLILRDRVVLCIPGCPGILPVDQAGLQGELELSRVLRFKGVRHHARSRFIS